MERFVVPNYIETKGSLFLRSNANSKYAEPVLTNSWHIANQANPKDYDINQPNGNLLSSTYNHLGSDQNQPQFKSTTHAALEQREQLGHDYEEQSTVKKMVDKKSYRNCNMREGSAAESVLPKHPPGYDQMHLESTHRTDYQPPYPFTSQPPKPVADNTAAYRKCVSQFTDVDTWKRDGRNTFHDESGVYANETAKREAFPKTNTILQRLA